MKLHLREFRDTKNSGEQENNPLFVLGLDRKIHPSGSPFVITRQDSWYQMAILGTDFSILPSRSWQILNYLHDVVVVVITNVICKPLVAY